jgi:hypothetical protein
MDRKLKIMVIERFGNPTILITLAALAISYTCMGDVMVVGTQKHSGNFAGYENNEFLFSTRGGRMLRQGRMQVRSISLDTPRKVNIVEAGKKTVEASLVGYDRSRFTIKENGAERAVLAMRIKQITMKQEAPVEGNPERMVPVIDISPLEARNDLTPRQSAALKDYKSARNEYDTFLSESSAMVAQRDGATGARREELINRLRTKKNDEQPLKRRLASAEATLLNTIPRPWARPAREKNGETTGAALPEISEDEVLLIDVSGLEKAPDLNKEQKTALQNYKAAKSEYERLTIGATGTDQTEAQERAGNRVREAQRGLLKAFPGIRFSE